MNKKFYLIVTLLVCLGVANVVVAVDTITLPNPLCPNPQDANNCVSSLPQLIVKVTQYVSSVVGILATFVFIWAGFLFVTSAGNADKVGQAKKALLYGVIGVIIAVVGRGLAEVIQSVITP